MAHVQINCTHKLPDHYDPHIRIQGVAGNAGGGRYSTEKQVLNDLHPGLNSCYVTVDGHNAKVVSASHNGHP